MTGAGDVVFAYGTLMRGLPLHSLLDGRALFVASGTIAGRLLDLGEYPGAVPDSAGTILGEVFRLHSRELLAELDAAEGSEFPRCLTPVRLDDGRKLDAWVYWFTGSPGRVAPIPGGDYRRHLALTTLREKH